MRKIKVTDKESAWAVARLVFPTDCTLDERKSRIHDYAVYGSTEEGYDGFEIHEREKQLWVYLSEDGETVQIDVAGASPSETKELAEAKKRIAELEEYSDELERKGQTADELNRRIGETELRAEEAEAEVQRLKAKLYDVLIEGKG